MNYLLIKNEADIKQAAQLAASIWRECFAQILDIRQIEYMLEKFQSTQAISQQINSGYEYYFIMTDEGQVGGYTAIKEEDDYLFLSKLYLQPNNRGKGLAQQTLAFINYRAKELLKPKVRLTVNKHNSRAINAYKKAGFCTYDTQKVSIGEGWFMDDYLMERNVQ